MHCHLRQSRHGRRRIADVTPVSRLCLSDQSMDKRGIAIGMLGACIK